MVAQLHSCTVTKWDCFVFASEKVGETFARLVQLVYEAVAE